MQNQFTESHFLQRLQESVTLEFARRSRELKAQGKDIISLSIGEPDFNTPDFVKEALKKAIDENYSHYPPVNGFLELRKAISDKLSRENNLCYSPDEIVVSTGAKQCIANTLLALLNPEDEVIILAPYWVSYKQIVELTGAKVVELVGDIQNDFIVSKEQLAEAVTDKTKLIMYSSPSNPAGAIYTEEQLRGFAEIIASQENLWVLSDEIYEYITYGEKCFSIGSIPEVRDRVITINGLSKGYAMTGYRLGYMAAPLPLAKACSKIQGQFTSGTNAATQIGAIAAIQQGSKGLDDMVKTFESRKYLLKKELSEIPGFVTNDPKGAFYLFANIEAYKETADGAVKFTDTSKLCIHILENYGVAMVPGEAFGMPWHVRLSYASSEKDLLEAAKRLKQAFANFK